MRRIEADEEPIAFIEWKEQDYEKGLIERSSIKYERSKQTDYQGKPVSSDIVWRILPTSTVEAADRESKIHYYSKDELRKKLLEKQGHLCCYCGQRIFDNHHTRIEHIFPKSKDIRVTFKYFNLAAACQGGHYEYHIVEQGDSLASILRKYKTTEETLRFLNPRTDFDNIELKAKMRIEVSDNHCDVKKKDNVINLMPNICKFEEILFYEVNGKIYCEDQIFQNELDNILNLNYPTLKLKRENKYKSFEGFYDTIFELDAETQKKVIDIAIKEVKSKSMDTDGHLKFQEMFFVEEFFLNTLLP